MMQRFLTALIVIALALGALWAAIHWDDDPNPLMIDAAHIA